MDRGINMQTGNEQMGEVMNVQIGDLIHRQGWSCG